MFGFLKRPIICKEGSIFFSLKIDTQVYKIYYTGKFIL